METVDSPRTVREGTSEAVAATGARTPGLSGHERNTVGTSTPPGGAQELKPPSWC